MQAEKVLNRLIVELLNRLNDLRCHPDRHTKPVSLPFTLYPLPFFPGDPSPLQALTFSAGAWNLGPEAFNLWPFALIKTNHNKL